MIIPVVFAVGMAHDAATGGMEIAGICRSFVYGGAFSLGLLAIVLFSIRRWRTEGIAMLGGAVCSLAAYRTFLEFMERGWIPAWFLELNLVRALAEGISPR